jgi:hypothetical protein
MGSIIEFLAYRDSCRIPDSIVAGEDRNVADEPPWMDWHYQEVLRRYQADIGRVVGIVGHRPLFVDSIRP